MIAHAFIQLIRGYQRLGAFFHFPSQCVFLPTCSDYTIAAIEKYGLPIGLGKGIGRIVRCHPYGKKPPLPHIDNP